MTRIQVNRETFFGGLAQLARAAQEMEPGKEYTLSLEKKRRKRSLDANSYLWVLCTRLGEALGLSKEEVYRNHIKEAGKCDFVAVADRAEEALVSGWEAHGIGWFVEKVDSCKLEGCSKLCLYYGSSTYDTKEMARLIDNVVQDCLAVGVETLPPAELERLVAAWEA